jgi:hypothetical protein
MFRSPAVEPASEVVVPCDHPVPLTQLELDLGVPPESWLIYLGRRAIAIIPDDLGRDSVSRSDARRLLLEKREHQLRVARQQAVWEAEQIELDQSFRASLPRGLPVSAFAGDMSYGDLVAAEEAAGVPRRRSLMEESLSGQSGQYHSYQDEGGV